MRQFELAGISSTGVWRNVPSCDASENVQWDIAGEAPPQALRRHWDVVVNAAASTRWSMTKEEAFRANVATVKSLAEVCAPDTHVVHVSTAYAGGRSGAATDFRNNYEWSKAESERVADLSFSRLSIVRPSLIVGRREDGFAAKFTGMYLLVRGIVTGTIPVIVGSPTAYFDVVPVDDLAR
ncbi:MAG: SDR family oxidoreductase, partial [Solirubrobacterales bacterium]